MPSDSYEVKILDTTGGPGMVLPLLALMEFAFIRLSIKAFQGNVDALKYSTLWWIYTIPVVFLSLAIGYLIAVSTSNTIRTFTTQQFLIINEDGIHLPYTTTIIEWSNVRGYYVKEKPYVKGGAMNFLHVTLNKANYLFQNNVQILGRKIYDSEDLESLF